MAFQLGLGCRTVGYVQEHRSCRCCPPLACWLGTGCSLPLSVSFSIGPGVCCPGPVTLRTDNYTVLGGGGSDLCDMYWGVGSFSECTDSVLGTKTFTCRQQLSTGFAGLKVYTFEITEDWGSARKITTYQATKGSSAGCFSGRVSIAKVSTSYVNEAYGGWCDHPASVVVQFCEPESCFGGCGVPESVSLSGSAAIGGGCPFPNIDGTYDVGLFTHPGGDSWGVIDGGFACDWNLYLLDVLPACGQYVTTSFRLLAPGLISTDGYLRGQVHYAYSLNNIHALFNYLLPLPAAGYACPTGTIQIPFLSGSGFYYLVSGGPPLPVVNPPDFYLNFP